MRIIYAFFIVVLSSITFEAKAGTAFISEATGVTANFKELFFNDITQPFSYSKVLYNGHNIFNYEKDWIFTPPLANLLNNGDFEQGATGFGTDYSFVAQGLGVNNQYGVRSNPISFNVQFCSMANHTNKGSYMLVVDGNNNTSSRFWFYTVPVKANTSYKFTYWYATVDSYTPATVQVKINGSSIISTPFSNSTCTWIQVQATWNSGSNTTALIEMNSQSSLLLGNDFAIDDISFGPSCE